MADAAVVRVLQFGKPAAVEDEWHVVTARYKQTAMDSGLCLCACVC